jgi:HlyD family secretion protein
MVLLNVAKPGSSVKKGELVAEFDRQYQLNRLDDYKATVVQLEANMKKLQADLAVAKDAHEQLVRVAKADLDKARLDLQTIEVRSAIESEKFKLAVEEAEARYKQILNEVKLLEESQRAELRANQIDRDQAKIELKRAESNIERMVIRAPIDGIVVMQSIFRGGDFGQVQQGDQIYAGQSFMSIVDASSMVVNAGVNQVDSELLRIGMKATVKLDAYPGLQLPAHVYSVGAMTRSGGWRANYVKEIPVRLKLDKMDPKVIPDLSASADVVLASEKQAAMVSLESVFRDNPNSRPFVLLRGPAGWERREVELGLNTNTAAAVRSGLKKGDVVSTQRVVQQKE